jgi:hypothetical protein
VRGEPTANVTLTIHDRNAVKRFSEAADWLDIQLVDYLVVDTTNAQRAPNYTSWRNL